MNPIIETKIRPHLFVAFLSCSSLGMGHYTVCDPSTYIGTFLVHMDTFTYWNIRLIFTNQRYIICYFYNKVNKKLIKQRLVYI